MLHVLQFVLLCFQRFPTAPGNSMRHERDMDGPANGAHAMSALPLKADMCSAVADVRLGPKADAKAATSTVRSARQSRGRRRHTSRVERLFGDDKRDVRFTPESDNP